MRARDAERPAARQPRRIGKVMVEAPRTQEMRSRDAREALMRATIDVLISHGYNGLSIKEVASRSGMSRGALAHHYPSKAELVVAATAAVYDEALARGQRMARTVGAIRDPVGNFIADCTSVYLEWPFLAALEIIMVARTDALLMKQIQPVMQNYRQKTNATWLEVFGRAGIAPPESERILNLTLNLIRGIGVNTLWQVDQRANKRLLRGWADSLRAQLGARRSPTA